VCTDYDPCHIVCLQANVMLQQFATELALPWHVVVDIVSTPLWLFWVLWQQRQGINNESYDDKGALEVKDSWTFNDSAEINIQGDRKVTEAISEACSFCKKKYIEIRGEKKVIWSVGNTYRVKIIVI
jgi:hypothetical protein